MLPFWVSHRSVEVLFLQRIPDVHFPCLSKLKKKHTHRETVFFKGWAWWGHTCNPDTRKVGESAGSSRSH